MNDPFVRLHVQSCRCLEALHVGAVAKLGLGVAPVNSEILYVFEPLSVLLVTAQTLQAGHEHAVVQSYRGQTRMHVVRRSKVILLVVEVSFKVQLRKHIQFLPPMSLLLFSCHAVELLC